jgi:hypothetical protein
MKRLSCSSKAKTAWMSQKVSDNPHINFLINKAVKHSKAPYVQAIARSEQEPLAELERRVMKRLSPKLSLDRLKQIQKFLSNLSALDRADYLHKLQDDLNGRR